LIPVAGSERRP